MSRPRIGLDARMLEERQTGLGRYARALCRALPRVDPGSDYVVILRPGVDPGDIAAPENVTIARIPGWLDYPDNVLRGPAINRLSLHLYHALHHFVPPGIRRRTRVVFTLHDLIWVEHWRLTFDRRWGFLRSRSVGVWGTATMAHAVRRADRIVAISGASAAAARRRYGLPEGRITAVHHGLDPALFPAVNSEATLARDPPYVLSLGNTKPYKNVRGLLAAFARVAAARPGVALRVTGRGDSRERLGRYARKLGIAERVRFTGPVSHEKLLELLAGAHALAFPSFVEGFGFPVLEAMAAGCPVVTSDIPVTREIAGDAALFADPHDPAAIAAALTRVLEDAPLRERLRAAGRARAAAFTWERCARETHAVHRAALGG